VQHPSDALRRREETVIEDLSRAPEKGRRGSRRLSFLRTMGGKGRGRRDGELPGLITPDRKKEKVWFCFAEKEGRQESTTRKKKRKRAFSRHGNEEDRCAAAFRQPPWGEGGRKGPREEQKRRKRKKNERNRSPSERREPRAHSEKREIKEEKLIKMWRLEAPREKKGKQIFVPMAFLGEGRDSFCVPLTSRGGVSFTPPAHSEREKERKWGESQFRPSVPRQQRKKRGRPPIKKK